MSFQYVVKEGDTLFKIAEKFLGDGNRFRELGDVNGNPFNPPDATIFPGWVITVPSN